MFRLFLGFAASPRISFWLVAGRRVFPEGQPFLRWALVLSAALWFLTGCATKEIAPTSMLEDRLFPIGVYEQFVSIKFKENGKDSTRTFNCALSLKADSIQVVAMSRFNSSLFRIREDLVSRKVNVEVFADQLRSQEARIRDYYESLRPLLLSPKSGSVPKVVEATLKDESGRPQRFRLLERPFDLAILRYDANSIPQKLVMATKDVEVAIDISGYKLGNL